MSQFSIIDQDRIPCAVVAPVLEHAFSRWTYWNEVNRGNGSFHLEESSGKQGASDLLSAQYGGTPNTWYKRLQRILSGEQETCSLNHVDHFLVVLGQQNLWYVPPLSEYYFSEKIVGMAA